jgi:hypothetical protein
VLARTVSTFSAAMSCSTYHERLRLGAILDECVEALVQEAMIVGRRLERLGPGADGALRIVIAEMRSPISSSGHLSDRRGHRRAWRR